MIPEKEYKIQITSRDIQVKTNSIVKIEKLGVTSNDAFSIECNTGMVINMDKKEACFLKDFLNKHYELQPSPTKITKSPEQSHPTIYLTERDKKKDTTTDIEGGYDYDM